MEENKNEIIEGVENAPSALSTDAAESAPVCENVATDEATKEAAVAAEVEAESTEVSDTAVTEPQSPPSEYPVWSFALQVAEDRATLKKRGRRGALVYAIIMTVLFAICFATLAVFLITGNGANNGTYPPVDYLPDGNAVSLSALYAELNPSVVTVYCTRDGGAGIGSGFIYTESGYIITNEHVITDATDVVVYLSDGSEYSAEIVGSDAISDIAVLKIEAKWLKPVVIGDSDALSVGQGVMAIGTPASLGLHGTCTNGIISGLNRNVEMYNEDNLVEKNITLIQTNTSLNPGNSGGPLFTLNGEVVGINYMRYNGNISMGSTYSGLCFAIPINSAIKVVDEIIETGSYSGNGDVAEKAVNLGVTGGTVVEGQSITISGQTFTPSTNGVIISSVKEGYPAEGKLEVFDIITHIGGVATTTFEELKLEIKSYKVGDTVDFTVFRNNSSIVVSITF